MKRNQFFLYLLCAFFFLQKVSSQESDFKSDITGEMKPWTDKDFENKPENFQFAIISDRTGGHRPGVFGKAMENLNLLMPEFVMSVGDLIEGYTKNETIIDRQWAEFDSLLDPLGMRFFHIPGNHDISNEVMREEWIERRGRAYYHFIYKDVLFLAMDTNDGDDDATFSREQINYFKQVIRDNPDVRWTLLFMHHPVWLYKEFNGFIEIEEALQDRPYTVYAGHFHRYMQAVRKEKNYYVLATTGGGSQLLGPKFGQFDHITWITMTEDGPTMVNLKLDGFVKHDVVNQSGMEQARALIDAANFHSVMTLNTDRTGGKVYFSIKNSSRDSIHFSGRVFHHHHLELDRSHWDLHIAPNASQQLTVDWKLSGDMPWERTDPIELDFSIGYRTKPLEPPFQLEGVYAIPKVIQEDQIRFTEMDVFTKQREVTLTHDLKNMILRYTTDGSEPDESSPAYDRPFLLAETTTVKAALFDPKDGTSTGLLEKTYRKVTPADPVKTRRSQPGLSYQYFEGNFTTLPDFSVLTPVRAGVATDFDVEKLSGARIDHYALVYNGFIEVPKDGLYTFYTYSDDGSKVYLHDKLVVDNDGSHSARLRSGHVALKKGKHPIRIAYFEDFLGQVLQLFIRNPGAEERQEVSFESLSH